MTSLTQQVGFNKEAVACKFLQGKGFKLLSKNYRTFLGEIDLIMENKSVLVFIEVRYRKKGSWVNALESIHRQKQYRIIQSAKLYLLQNPSPKPCRFDVVAFKGNEISWIKDAFQVQ